MAKGAGKARKKLPKELAVIRADNCTGCDACIEVCPVDCIYKVPGQDMPGLMCFRRSAGAATRLATTRSVQPGLPVAGHAPCRAGHRLADGMVLRRGQFRAA